MSGEQQLWAARDWNGELYQFNVEPEDDGTEERPFFSAVNDEDDFNILRLPDELLPDLAPGEKCRVKIVRDE